MEEGEEPEEETAALGKHRHNKRGDERQIKQAKNAAIVIYTMPPFTRQRNHGTMNDEQESYNIWLHAIKAAACAELLPSAEKKAEANRLLILWQDHIDTLQQKYKTHDPINRHFRSYDPNIDSGFMSPEDDIVLKPDLVLQNFRPYTSPGADFGTMEPLYSVPSSIADNEVVVPRCNTRYYLQLLNPTVLVFSGVSKPLAQNLIRRYYDRCASRISILLFSDLVSGKEVVQFDTLNSCHVTCYILPSSRVTGVVVNSWIHEQTINSTDLCVFMRYDVASGDTNEQFIKALLIKKGIDTFIPSYPVMLSDDIVILAPIQIIQINGCMTSCNNAICVMESLCSRITVVLGAVICSTTHRYKHIKNVDNYWFATGLHDQADFMDGRIHLFKLFSGGYSIADLRKGDYLRPGTAPTYSYLATHIPCCERGTFSNDCKINIYAAIKCYRPRVLVILGIDYTKATRFIMECCDENTVIFCVDDFTNRAVEDNFTAATSPENKFHYNYLKYETFVSNVEAVARGLSKSMSMYSVKMDLFQSIEFLRYNIVPVEMVFIDNFDDVDNIYKIILHVGTYYPDAAIVGNDRDKIMGNAVVKQLQVSNPYLLRDDSYIILPRRRYVPEIKPFIDLGVSKYAFTVKTNTTEQHINELVTNSSDTNCTAALESFFSAHDIYAPLVDTTAVTRTILHIFVTKYFQLHEENAKTTLINVGSFNEVLTKKKFYNDVRQLLVQAINRLDGSVGINEDCIHVFDVIMSHSTIMK